ncbi:LOW QUALITY PROTEIN: putative E3 ubiquitin-protein ligase MARCHF10, partial [Pluvialis apricaria]
TGVRWEAQERQKFVSSAQYVRETPYKMDSGSHKVLILHCLFTVHLKTAAYWRDSINDTWSISSPSGTSYVGESLRSSHHSSSLESSNPSLAQTRFTPGLHIACVLHDQLPLTFLLVPYLQNHSSTKSNTTISPSASTEEVKKTTALSVLAEDCEEDQCCICQFAGASPTNPRLEPCGCVGSLQFVHQERLKKWLKAKIKSGADLEAAKTCELCKQNLITDVDNFNVNAYKNHQQSRWNTAIADLE